MATSNHHSIEVLESRIAPAAVFTYTDIDGDKVTIKTTKGTVDDLKAILTFSDPAALDDPTVPSQLQLINFSANSDVFSKTNLTITSKPQNGGDGLVNVGYIDATEPNMDLGAIKIDGDLSRIHVGTSQADTLAIKRLEVRSLGELGTSTQFDPSESNTASYINGSAGAIVVKGNVAGAVLEIGGNAGSITIGKSLIGGADNGTILQSGLIRVQGDVGTFAVKNIIGGDDYASGRVEITGDVKSFIVKGSVLGGTSTVTEGSDLSGAISITGTITKELRIDGNIKGGSGFESGSVSVGAVKTAVIKGSILGGIREASGTFRTTILESTTDVLQIGGDIKGGSGSESGSIAVGSVKTAVIKGSILGGSQELSGSFWTTSEDATLGVLQIGGDIKGGSGYESGAVIAGAVKKAVIKGSILGGSQDFSGSFRVFSANTALDMLQIDGDIKGGSARETGLVSVGAVKTAVIEGAIIGGSGESSGIFRTTSENAESGSITVGGIIGGSGIYSGNLHVSEGGSLERLVVNGSVNGGTNEYTGYFTGDYIATVQINGSVVGGNGYNSGGLRVGGLDSLTIKGSIIAGGDSRTGYVDASGHSNTTLTIGGSLTGSANEGAGMLTVFSEVKSVTIKGSIFGGGNGSTGALAIRGQIETITVRGDLIGQEGAQVPLISIQGVLDPASTEDTIAVKNISIGGDVRWAQILSGYDRSNPVNADASIGSVLIKGDFIASSIVAGGVEGNDGQFGTEDDFLILDTPNEFNETTRIESIIIGGKIAGSSMPGDNFGFVAQAIGKIVRAGVTLDLEVPALVLAPLTNDVKVRVGIQTPL